MAEYSDYIQDIVKTKKVSLFLCHCVIFSKEIIAAVIPCVINMYNAEGFFCKSDKNYNQTITQKCFESIFSVFFS